MTAGTIDYENGSVSLNKVTVNDFLNSSGISFIVSPVSENVTSKNNDILEISDITIEVTT